MTLGTIVSSKGMSAEGLHRCSKVLEALSAFVTFPKEFAMLPKQTLFVISINHGLVSKDRIAEMMKHMELDAARLGVLRKNHINKLMLPV